MRLALLSLALMAAAPGMAAGPNQVPVWRLEARVVAVGLPGVAGVRQVGRFHSGGPIPGNPDFLLSTGTGQVLDPERVLVAVASNFGAPLGEKAHAAGSVLSIDPRGDPSGGPLIVPRDLAASGGQGAAAGGAIRIYTAQTHEFQNRVHNGSARTADYSAASAPLYLSINNAFGRPWIANAPQGQHGEGSVTVVDPDGTPLVNPPSRTAGGVFAGRLTNREWVPKAQPSGWIAKLLNYRASPQLTPGTLNQGALGTAFLGPSPDGSGFAVFAAVTGDGSVVQIHVQDGVDGLAPSGTIDTGLRRSDLGVIGIAFKWNPDRALLVADPARHQLVRLDLGDDQRQFTVARTSAVASPALNQPVDIAPALPEIANPHFASHTTLAGDSDLYVANRGDGSLLRMSQDGQVLARAEVGVPGLGILPGGRIAAIAVSADAHRIWLTIEGELPAFPGHEGALIEVSAFDTSGPFSPEPTDRPVTANSGGSSVGAVAFRAEYTPKTGLGPLFNAQSCVACHPGPGGASTLEEHFVRRVAHMESSTGRVTPIVHPNSPVARRHSIVDLGHRGAPAAGMPRSANVISLRMPLALYVSGRLDEVPDAVIEAQAVAKGDGIHGRAHYVTGIDGQHRAGRYGWKAQIATLDEMVADAFANEIGIGSAIAPESQVGSGPPDDDGSLVRAVAEYLRSLRRPGGASP